MQKTQPKINHTDRKFAEIRHLWGEDGEEEEKQRQTQQNKTSKTMQQQQGLQEERGETKNLLRKTIARHERFRTWLFFSLLMHNNNLKSSTLKFPRWKETSTEFNF